MPLDPKAPLYPSIGPRRVVHSVATAAVIAVLLTLFVVYRSWSSKDPFILYLTIGFWAVLPPFWFWCEYFFVYRVHGTPDTLELFKYGQDVAKAIWAGVLTGLIAFAASDVFTEPVADPNHLEHVSVPAEAFEETDVQVLHELIKTHPRT
jgi:hypothetical protein